MLEARADSIGAVSVSINEVISEVAEAHALKARKKELNGTLEVLVTSGTELTGDTEVDCDRVGRTEEEVAGVVICMNNSSEKEFSVEFNALDHVSVVEFAEQSRSEVVVVILSVLEGSSIDCVHNHNNIVSVLEDVMDLRSETSVSGLFLHQAFLKNVLVATISENLNSEAVDDEELAEAAEGDWLCSFESLDEVGSHGWFLSI
jgi:hypothetical protein